MPRRPHESLPHYICVACCYLIRRNNKISATDTSPRITCSVLRHMYSCRKRALRVNTMGPGKTSRQPNFPIWSWVPGEIVLTSPWPLSDRATASWALINAISPLFSAAFGGTFDQLKLIRTSLIFKIIKHDNMLIMIFFVGRDTDLKFEWRFYNQYCLKSN